MAGRRGLFVRKDATTGTSPQDARLALAGLLTPAGDLAVAAGVISGCGVTGTSGWTYNVGAGHVVGTRGATDGAVLFAVDGTTATPAVAAAPASGSRWDLIWVRQRDTDSGDADSAAEVGVTSGTSGGSPSKPYGSVPAGAVVLAEAQVSSGATQTAHASVTITPVALRVAARGGIVSATSTQRALLAGTASSPLWADDNAALWRHAGSGWVRIVRNDDTPPIPFAAAGGAPADGAFAPGWGPSPAAGFTNAVTYQRLNGEVVLGGVVRNASAFATPTEICRLPVGFRPSPTPDSNGRRRFLVAYGGNATGKVEVYGSGLVVADTGTGAGDTISLDGVRFRAEG